MDAGVVEGAAVRTTSRLLLRLSTALLPALLRVLNLTMRLERVMGSWFGVVVKMLPKAQWQDTDMTYTSISQSTGLPTSPYPQQRQTSYNSLRYLIHLTLSSRSSAAAPTFTFSPTSRHPPLSHTKLAPHDTALSIIVWLGPAV